MTAQSFQLWTMPLMSRWQSRPMGTGFVYSVETLPTRSPTLVLTLSPSTWRLRAGNVKCATSTVPVEMPIMSISADITNRNLPKIIFCNPFSCQFLGLALAVRSLYVKVGEGGESGFQCSACEHFSRSRQNMENHVEAKHVQTEGWPCHLCHKVCPSRNAFNVHFSRHHKPKDYPATAM